jgi:hypothetical protein
MKVLDQILATDGMEAPIFEEEVMGIFKNLNYKQEAVENWLYENEVKTVIESSELSRELARKNISFEKFLELIDVSDNKLETIKVVFRAYKEFFNVNVCFKDFFDSYMNPDYGKVSDKIYKEVYGE